jgi:ATP-binding cassette subfamily B protein
VFAHLQRLDMDYYIKNNTGDLITRSIVDVQAVRMMMGFVVVAMIDVVVTLSVSLYNMGTTTTPLLALLAIIPVPPLMFLIIKVRLLVRRRYTKVQEAISAMSSKVQENVTGIRVMKSFTQEDKESEAFSELSRRKIETEVSLAKVYALINPAVALTFGLVFSIFLIAGGSLVARDVISLGDYVSFNTYLMLIMGPVGNVGRIVERWQRGVASIKRLDDILEAQPKVNDVSADTGITTLSSGAISARDLSFSYDGERTIITQVSFDIPSGGSLAIMGPTGSGKSTIIQLIMHMMNSERGTLFIDGRDINEIPLKTLRTGCAYVPQESFLFSDSILENIRFCDSTISDEKVMDAAAQASVHDSISQFPDGYATVVGERGMTLSGGQKQRVALARALARDPKILLLDDCMSAVDAETEREIIESLRTRMRGCTTILVTHRLSAASLADNILILDEGGGVAEYGSYGELLDKGGALSRLSSHAQEEEVCEL